MLLHNRSSSAITSLLTGSLFEEPWVVCMVYQSQLQNWEALVFLNWLEGGNPTMGGGRLKEKKHIMSGFEKQRLRLAMLMLT